MKMILVDRLPKVFPIADCREGLNTGFTAFNDSDSVTVSPLVIADPVSVNNVDLNQLWCIVTKKDPCNYGNCRISNRNHIETEEEGMIRNIGTCQYIKADPSQDGEVKMIAEVYQCKLNFIYDVEIYVPSRLISPLPQSLTL